MKRVLLLNLFYTSLFILFTITSIKSQEDPFGINETGPQVVKSQDIFLLWMEDIGGGNVKSYQKVYRYKTDGILLNSLNVDTMLTKTSRREDNRSGKSAYVDVASGKLNNDPYDDVISIWRTSNSNQKIEIMISHFDTTGFFTNSTAVTLDAGEEIRQDEEIYVRAADFDADNEDEFIVAYRNASDSVIFCVYDVDSTLQATLIQRFSNTKVAGSGLTHFVKYFIETADLNDDGIDELISFTWETAVTSTYVPITVRVYTFESNSIVAKGVRVIQVPKSSATSLQDFIMASAKGQFDDDKNDELVFSSVVKSNDIHVSHHYILYATQNLQTISVGPRGQFTLSDHNTNGLTEFSLAAGDLNDTFNKRDEAVFAAGNRVRVLAVNDDYSFEAKTLMGVVNGGGSDYLQSSNYLKISDLNMDNREDIILVKNVVAVNPSAGKGFLTYAISFEDSTLSTAKVLARLFEDENQNDVYHRYAIAVGNFDGFDFTIGQPSRFSAHNIGQPIVILNSPPTHFDKFGNDIFDVSVCYNGGACDFHSNYTRTVGGTYEVSMELNADWQISAGLKTEGTITAAPMGIGIETNYKLWATKSYGLHFSLTSSYKISLEISQEIEARRDDRIYSTIVDYDVWEYPVFHGNESFSRRSYFALVPVSYERNWYESKSYQALNYIPSHEVGNILSYYPYDTLSHNPFTSEIIRASYSADTFEMNSSSGNDSWHLTYSDFLSSGVSLSFNTTLDAGAELGGLSTSFKFSKELMTTHKITVSEKIKLDVNFGNVDLGIGDVRYKVTPYAYWAKNGAIVLDYAVQPILAPPGFPNTWWQDRYNDHPDPAFLLPWRLDPEKGYTLSEQAKRFQTKDISFNPYNPNLADTVTTRVLIRNLSLIPTASPVSVSFYVGDPDSGGVPLVGINGSNNLTINSIIPDRGTAEAEFKWVVTSGLPQYPRIYAVLDRDNNITEIHEENNKGFNVLGVSSVSDIEDENNIIPEEYALYQSYPNPFNPTTTIKYSLPNSDIVSLKVFDILGREVAVLVNEYKTSGTYSIEFNANQFASGVYFYQLESGNFLETKKMILLK